MSMHTRTPLDTGYSGQTSWFSSASQSLVGGSLGLGCRHQGPQQTWVCLTGICSWKERFMVLVLAGCRNKHHSLGGLWTNLFLIVLEAGSPRVEPAWSGSGESPHEDFGLLTVSSCGGGAGALGLFYKDTSPIHEGSSLRTWSPPTGPHLVIQSPLDSTYEFGGWPIQSRTLTNAVAKQLLGAHLRCLLRAPGAVWGSVWGRSSLMVTM